MSALLDFFLYVVRQDSKFKPKANHRDYTIFHMNMIPDGLTANGDPLRRHLHGDQPRAPAAHVGPHHDAVRVGGPGDVGAVVAEAVGTCGAVTAADIALRKRCAFVY